MSASGIIPTSGLQHDNSTGNYEIPLFVRTWINDLDSSNYKYSDDRLNQTICIAARFVKNDAEFATDYTIGKDFISPNPSEYNDLDFINLVGLKTACIIIGSELKTEASNAISIKDGPSAIDLRGVSSTLNSIYKDVCNSYDQSLLDYKAGNSLAGQAILGPYSPGSDFIARTHNDYDRGGHYFRY